MANRGTSVDEGWKLVSFGLCVFSGSFGVRSIVLCKCSGKYIDIYFIFKNNILLLQFHQSPLCIMTGAEYVLCILYFHPLIVARIQTSSLK